MREILFRGKRQDTGKWVEGSLHIEYGETTKDGNRAIDYRILGMRGQCDYVDPNTVGQYTGLKDCNSKPVFEGDIVRLFSDVKRTFDISDGEVRWVRGAFVVGNGDSFRSSLSVVASYDWVLRGEVIGNIHDNPDLLED